MFRYTQMRQTHKNQPYINHTHRSADVSSGGLLCSYCVLIVFVRNYAERVSFVHVLISLKVRAELKVKKNKVGWKTSHNLDGL